MTWDGSGSYTPPPATFPETNGTVIDAGRYNPTILDLAAGITACLAKNGENVPTANLAMGGFKHTGAADGSASGQYIVYNQSTAAKVGGTFQVDGISLGVGTGAAAVSMNTYGNGSGASGGSYVGARAAGTITTAIGNYSALLGGAYDATSVLYGATSLKISLGGTTMLAIGATGHHVPGSNNAQDLGATATRWRDLFARFVSTTGQSEGLRLNHDNGFLSIYDTAGTTRSGYLAANAAGGGMVLNSDASSTLSLATGGTARFTVDATSITPALNNTYDIGTNALRVKKVWGVDASFSGTSSFGAVSSSGFSGPLAATDLTGNLAIARFNGGSGASSSTFWRGDGTWVAALMSEAFTASATVGGISVGYRTIPKSATTSGSLTTAEIGKCVPATGGVTIPNATFAAGDALSIYNDSGSGITITAGITTLRLGGTTSTGSRTLAPRGMATVWFVSGTEAVISGAGLS